MNTLATIALRDIGREHEAMRTFTSCMNMPPSMVKTAFTSISDDLFEDYEDAANECKAAFTLHYLLLATIRASQYPLY